MQSFQYLSGEYFDNGKPKWAERFVEAKIYRPCRIYCEESHTHIKRWDRIRRLLNEWHKRDVATVLLFAVTDNDNYKKLLTDANNHEELFEGRNISSIYTDYSITEYEKQKAHSWGFDAQEQLFDQVKSILRGLNADNLLELLDDNNIRLLDSEGYII